MRRRGAQGVRLPGYVAVAWIDLQGAAVLGCEYSLEETDASSYFRPVSTLPVTAGSSMMTPAGRLHRAQFMSVVCPPHFSRRLLYSSSLTAVSVCSALCNELPRERCACHLVLRMLAQLLAPSSLWMEEEHWTWRLPGQACSINWEFQHRRLIEPARTARVWRSSVLRMLRLLSLLCLHLPELQRL